jgi:hypothetical protein
MAFPLKPPSAWFETPEPDQPTPLTFEKSGKVYGHIALWGSCHRGFLNGALAECVQAPRSGTNYSEFHLAPLETQEGTDVRVGKITYATGHAPLTANLQSAARHYDNTGSVGAFVRARDGNLGIWVAGSVRSDLSPEGFRDLRANPPSGDWRTPQSRRGLEMVATLAVPVPGLPVMPQLALAASANGENEVVSLILPPWEVGEEMEFLNDAGYHRSKEALLAAIGYGNGRKTKAYRRKIASLTSAVLTSKARKGFSESTFAIPERRAYPVPDRAHAANALSRSSGTPDEARVKRFVCKKFPDMPSCKA